MNLPRIDIPMSELRPLNDTRGATNCSYFESHHPHLGHLFIKRGEKVTQEIENYLRFRPLVSDRCLLDPVGTLDDDTLVLPYADDSLRGFLAVEHLWSGYTSVGEFESFQCNVFSLFSELYDCTLESTLKKTKSSMMTDRVDSRIAQLVEMGDYPVNGPTGNLVTVSQLLNHSVPVSVGSKLHHAPSLLRMVERLSPWLGAAYSYPPCAIHADPQPSNVIEYLKALKIVDLSDIRVHEDVSWDLAKWMNYIARFHGVVRARGRTGIDNDNVSPPSATTLRQLRSALLSQITGALPIDLHELHQRTLLGEFVVNLSTIRRHILRFPEVASLLLEAVVESYSTALTAIQNTSES